MSNEPVDYVLRFYDLQTRITTYGVGTYPQKIATAMASRMNAGTPIVEVTAVHVSSVPGVNIPVYTLDGCVPPIQVESDEHFSPYLVGVSEPMCECGHARSRHNTLGCTYTDGKGVFCSCTRTYFRG